MKKVLIATYSQSGRTRAVADQLASLISNADQYMINVEDGTFSNAKLEGTTFNTVANENRAFDNEIDVWLEITLKGREAPVKSNTLTFNARIQIWYISGLEIAKMKQLVFLPFCLILTL